MKLGAHYHLDCVWWENIFVAVWNCRFWVNKFFPGLPCKRNLHMVIFIFFQAAIFISLANAFVTVALQGREKAETRQEEWRGEERKENEGECSVIVHLSLVFNLLALQIIELNKGAIWQCIIRNLLLLFFTVQPDPDQDFMLPVGKGIMSD